MIAVGRPSIGTVRNQRASLGPLDHLGPCLSLRSLVLPPCEDPLLLPNADLRGICACTAAAEVASRGRSTTRPEAVSALCCLIRDQYVTPDAPELRHVIPESILYCAARCSWLLAGVMPKKGSKRGFGFSTSKGTKSQQPSTVPHGNNLRK